MKEMTNKKSNIILPKSVIDKKTDDEIDNLGRKLMHEAKKKAEGKKCTRCGKKNLKVVPLHESPFPLPSKIVLFCRDCKYNEVLMEQKSNSVMKYFYDKVQEIISGSNIKTEKDTDIVIKDKRLLDKLIRKWKK